MTILQLAVSYVDAATRVPEGDSPEGGCERKGFLPGSWRFSLHDAGVCENTAGGMDKLQGCSLQRSEFGKLPSNTRACRLDGVW
jgi:hypothetical protein